MARLKYDENTFPLLAEKNAREGFNDEQNAKALGITTSTFYDYQLKYSEFLDAIKRGKQPVVIKVENKLLDRALGFEYKERTVEYNAPIGNESPTIKSVKEVTKYALPDVTAIMSFLNNKARSEYKRNWDKEGAPPPETPELPNIDKLSNKEVDRLYEIEKANGNV